MKIIFFVPNGITNEAHVLYRLKQEQVGNKVMFSNGSFKYGFEDSCDKIVLAVENKHIELWASTSGIHLEKFGIVSTPVLAETKESVFDLEVEEIVNAQLAKATASLVFKDKPKEVTVEELNKVEPGIYSDPDGNQYERKRGPKTKSDLVAAIKKFGIDKLVKE
tara:strand:+ start:402 stop:893 length:492 start_codon:yes stop_codon:yes gene_type:complete